MSIVNERAEIKSQLQTVSGIGAVYFDKVNPTLESEFKARYVDGLSKINFCEITIGEGDESADNTEGGVRDEQNLIQQVLTENTWTIDLYVGYKYDPTTPSEVFFQDMIDAIQSKFRFLQNLNGKAYMSYPLQRVSSGMWQMVGGLALCHRAVFKLRVRQLITNPN